MQQLTVHGLPTLVAALTTAGTTTITTTSPLDMTGYEGVVFFVTYGTAAAGNFLKAQQGSVSDGSDAADLEGSKCIPSADAGVACVDVYRPQKRYVRPSCVRGTSTTLGEIWAFRYGKDKMPVSITNITRVASPAEGTA